MNLQHSDTLTDPQTDNPGRVLVIDDDPSILFIISKILTRHKYEVTSVCQAEEALELVKDQTFELVTCDISMPGMNGLQFLNALKKVDPNLASVVITGRGSVGMAVKAMESGALGFITKPFSEPELIQSISSAVSHSRIVKETTLTKMYAPMLESASVALLHALEAKDQDCTGHGQQVGEIAQRVALATGMSQEEAVQVYFAGLFHDIGKIGVPDLILAKAGDLTEKEQLELQKHSQIGSKIIGSVTGLEKAANYILYHHEQFDGAGYPGGLRGEEIPLGSRIVFVADVYDQLLSRRPSANGLSPSQAVLELRKSSGTQFDPEVINTFVRLFAGSTIG